MDKVQGKVRFKQAPPKNTVRSGSLASYIAASDDPQRKRAAGSAERRLCSDEKLVKFVH